MDSVRFGPIEATEPARPGRTAQWFVIVVSGIGLVGGCFWFVVIPMLFEARFRAKCRFDEVHLRVIEAAVADYAAANGGRYPERLDELVTPDAARHTYLDATRVPRDPWGVPYHYESPRPGESRPHIYSLGRDGLPGGQGDDADVHNLDFDPPRDS